MKQSKIYEKAQSLIDKFGDELAMEVCEEVINYTSFLRFTGSNKKSDKELWLQVRREIEVVNRQNRNSNQKS